MTRAALALVLALALAACAAPRPGAGAYVACDTILQNCAEVEP